MKTFRLTFVHARELGRLMDSAGRFSLQCSLFSNTQSHLDACPLFPVQCPNMCGKMAVPREKVHYIIPYNECEVHDAIDRYI